MLQSVVSAKGSESGSDKRRGNSSGTQVLRSIERERGWERIMTVIKATCFHYFFIRSNSGDFHHKFGEGLVFGDKWFILCPIIIAC